MKQDFQDFQDCQEKSSSCMNLFLILLILLIVSRIFTMNTIFKIKKKTFVNGSLLSCKSCKSYNPAPASIFKMKYTLLSCSSC